MSYDGGCGTIVNEAANTYFISDGKLHDAKHDVLSDVTKLLEWLQDGVHGLDGVAAEESGVVSSA